MTKKNEIKTIIDALDKQHTVLEKDIRSILENLVSPYIPNEDTTSQLHVNERLELEEYLRLCAQKKALSVYGNKVYMRGLIEFTNYCKNDCLYCGIRSNNKKAERYRLTKEEILECCRLGYEQGMRTFVMQGGEDGYFTKDKLCDIVKNIKMRYPDCAVTLSVGEKSKEEYEAYKKAGTNRFLLRHETANVAHYSKLHPNAMSLENRMQCLKHLKEIGFQTGTGFMVGSPGQTIETLCQDLIFIQSLHPEMLGIGPFLAHADSIFSNEPNGSVNATLIMISMLRLLEPNALIPATTALGTASTDGREQGILSGANVVMPNLSPLSVRKKYLLYDNKISTGDEVIEGIHNLRKKIASIGYELTGERGDFKNFGANT